jgi:hypothetical protein
MNPMDGWLLTQKAIVGNSYFTVLPGGRQMGLGYGHPTTTTQGCASPREGSHPGMYIVPPLWLYQYTHILLHA